MQAIQEYAMDLLAKAHQATLPVDEMAVARWLNAKVAPYSKARKFLSALNYWDYAQTVQGLSVNLEGSFCICYPDDLPLLERRSVIMHECGHIYLGHLGDGSILGKSGNRRQDASQEAEASTFALFALAPPDLLSRAKLHTPDQIARVCRICDSDARTVAAHLRPRRICKFLTPVFIVAVLLCLFLWSHSAQPPQTPQSPLPAQIVSTVYITRSGSCYHRQDCYQIVGHEVVAIDLDQAAEMGYKPCKTCHPNQPQEE